MCQSGYIQSPEGDCVKPMVESYGLHNEDDEVFENILTRWSIIIELNYIKFYNFFKILF